MDRGDLLLRPEPPGLARRGHVHHLERLAKGGQDGDRLAGGVEGHRATVKDQLIVPADLVHVEKGRVVAPGVVAQEPVADALLAHAERRGRDVQEERGALLRQGRDGIQVVRPAAGPQVGVVPGVLADRDAQHLAPEGDRPHRLSRPEIPRLVEHVVGGEKGLVDGRLDASPVGQDRGVHQRLAAGAAVGQGRPDEDAQVGMPRRVFHHPAQPLLHRGDEPTPLEEVLGGIADEVQLREHHELRAGAGHLIDGLQDPPHLPLDVADQRVVLRDRDPHA